MIKYRVALDESLELQTILLNLHNPYYDYKAFKKLH